MSTIAFSSAWTARSIPWIFRHSYSAQSGDLSNAGLLSSGGTYNNGPWYWARIDIMKGVVPTTVVGLEAVATRSSDLLMSFTTPSSNPSGEAVQYFLLPGVSGNLGQSVGSNPQLINTIYKTAIATGVATWFRWMVTIQPSYTSDPINVAHQIIGTVSTNGGGGDLQMDTTTITAGQQYRISSIQFFTPTSFTY
jgi:hypothetical protein